MNRRQLAEERRYNVLKRQGLVSAPKGPLVERDEAGTPTVITPAGLKLVERLARVGAPQSKIASSLGILAKQFRNKLGASQGENALRMAWERGHADYEHSMVKLLTKHARTSFVAAIYLSKARLGWTEESKQQALTQNSVVLMLPKPRTREEFFKMMQCEDPARPAPPEPMKTIEALPAPAEKPTESEPVKESTDDQS